MEKLNNITMSDYRNYILRFNLTGFIGARVIEAYGDDDQLERGVFIPIERNSLYEVPGNKSVFCEAFVNEVTYRYSDGRSHSLKQKLNKEKVEKLASLGYKTPSLGALWNNEIYKTPSFQQKTSEKRVKFNREKK